MKGHLINLATAIYEILVTPIVLRRYFRKEVGNQYNINTADKVVLALKVFMNNYKMTSATMYLEQMLMITKILQIPKSTDGCLIECGCYKGGTTVNLSIVASLVGRQLHVFDSFEGLPEKESHRNLNKQKTTTYNEGDFKGELQEVKENIEKLGVPDVCTLHKGYFKDTLPNFEKDCVFIYADVDLRDSLLQVLTHSWLSLKDCGFFFTHEARQFEIVSLFFDDEFWNEKFGTNPPGIVGAGNGVGLYPTLNSVGFGSAIAYIRKST